MALTDKNKLRNREHSGGDSGEKNELLIKPTSTSKVHEEMSLVVFLRDRTGVHFSLQDAHLTTCACLMNLIIHEQDLPAEATDAFSLWLVSPLIELRLKAHHNPFEVVKNWDELCAKYTDATDENIHESEPVLMFQRDVFFSKEQEQHIQNKQILCLLYHEAKYNVIEGRYVLHEEDYHHLAGLQALSQFGSYHPQQRVLANYRTNLVQFYPEHMYLQNRFSLFNRGKVPIQPCEERFMEAHKKASEELRHMVSGDNLVPLYRKYLELLWSYPFYGGAFFSGLVEPKMSKLRRLVMRNPDFNVAVNINTDGVTVFNKDKEEFLLYVPYDQLSWEYQNLELDGDSDPPPTLLLQFMCDQEVDDEPGQPVTKLLQVYSREAKLMDALIETCVRKKLELQKVKDVDGVIDAAQRRFLNKLDKLSLETFTMNGEQVYAG